MHRAALILINMPVGEARGRVGGNGSSPGRSPTAGRSRRRSTAAVAGLGDARSGGTREGASGSTYDGSQSSSRWLSGAGGSEGTCRDLEFWDDSEMTWKAGYYL
jgi:hypothetical protein